MFRIAVPVGYPNAIIQALAEQFYTKSKRREITSSGVFLPVRSEAVMSAADGPLILASADTSLSAFAGSDLHLDVTVTYIIEVLRRRRKTLALKDIVMCMHFGDEGNENLFMEQATRSGLQHAWVGNSLSLHPRLARAQKARATTKKDLIVVKRTI